MQSLKNGGGLQWLVAWMERSEIRDSRQYWPRIALRSIRATQARRLLSNPRQPPKFRVGGHNMKVREAIRLIEDDGWFLVATRGSHRQYKHPTKPGRVTVAGKPSDDLAPGTLNSILKQAGLKE